MSALANYRFTLLLVTLALLLVVYPVISPWVEGRLLLALLIALVFIVAFLGIFISSPHRGVALLLGIPTLLVNWLVLPLEGSLALPLPFLGHAFAVLFLTWVLFAILYRINAEPAITYDCVAGAFCGYLLIALVFAHIYQALFLVHSESFTGLKNEPEPLLSFEMVYFSFGALTSAGSGDILARKPPAQALSMIETVIAQFYIAGLIGELIGKRVSQVFASPAPTPPPGPPVNSDTPS